MAIRKEGVARGMIIVLLSLLALGVFSAPVHAGVSPEVGRAIYPGDSIIIGETNLKFFNATGGLISKGVLLSNWENSNIVIPFEGSLDSSRYEEQLLPGEYIVVRIVIAEGGNIQYVIESYIFFVTPTLSVDTYVNGEKFYWVTRGADIVLEINTNMWIIEGLLPNYITYKLLDPSGALIQLYDNETGKPVQYIDVSEGTVIYKVLNTGGLRTGMYTFSIKADPDTNDGLDAEGPKKSFEVRSKGVSIEANVEKQTVTKDIVFTISTTPHTLVSVNVTWGRESKVMFAEGGTSALGFADENGEFKTSAVFGDAGSYEITATEDIMGTTDSIFVEIVPYETELDVDKDPAVYHIGENVKIAGSSTAGESITLKIEDEVVATDLDVDGFDYTWKTENFAPYSYKISIWVLPFSDPFRDRPDESVSVILLRGGLYAEPSASFVALGDEFNIAGIVPGRDFVDILTIAPDGGSGYGLDPSDIVEDTEGKLDAPGLTYETSGVDTDGKFETEGIAVSKDVDTGTYLILALNYGRDGEWGISRESNFLRAISNDYTTPLGVKTTDQILAILKDRTIDAPGTDDLLGLTTIKVEQGFVTVDALADVPLGGDITVTGTTNRQVDTAIIVTVEGTDERTPSLKPKIAKVEANEKIYYNSFEVTFATKSANLGEYIVTVDDGDGHTASTTLSILQAVEPAVNVSATRPPTSGSAEVNERVAETPVPTPTTQPTITPSEPPVMESTAVGPGFLSLWIVLIILWFVIAIIIAVWVYRDATDRGQNGVLWVIIVLILSVVGLLIWLARRPKMKKEEV